MEIAGYQSDLKVTNVFNEDNFSAEKNVAEFGVTTGTGPAYALTLNPPLSKAYEVGLRLQVRFHQNNTGAVTLNVDEKGAIPVMKLKAQCSEDVPERTPNSNDENIDQNTTLTKTALLKAADVLFQPLEANDLSTVVHYILVYDGKQFQIVNSFPECLTQGVTPITPTDGLFFNRQEFLELKPEHIDARVFHAPGRNRYAAINGNLIVARDIRLKMTAGPGSTVGAFLKLPKPLDQSLGTAPGFVQSLEGETFYYSMDEDGVVQIQGELKQPNDEINFNFYPYIAKYPLEYDTEKVLLTTEDIAKEVGKANAKTTRTKATKKPKK